MNGLTRKSDRCADKVATAKAVDVDIVLFVIFRQPLAAANSRGGGDAPNVMLTLPMGEGIHILVPVIRYGANKLFPPYKTAHVDTDGYNTWRIFVLTTDRRHCADKYRVVSSHSTHSGQSLNRYVGQRLKDQPLPLHTVVNSSVTPPSPRPTCPRRRLHLPSACLWRRWQALIHEVQTGRPLFRVEGARGCRFGRKGFLQQLFPRSDRACFPRAHVTVGRPRCVRPPALFGAAPGGGEGGYLYRHLGLQYVRRFSCELD